MVRQPEGAREVKWVRDKPEKCPRRAQSRKVKRALSKKKRSPKPPEWRPGGCGKHFRVAMEMFRIARPPERAREVKWVRAKPEKCPRRARGHKVVGGVSKKKRSPKPPEWQSGRQGKRFRVAIEWLRMARPPERAREVKWVRAKPEKCPRRARSQGSGRGVSKKKRSPRPPEWQSGRQGKRLQVAIEWLRLARPPERARKEK